MVHRLVIENMTKISFSFNGHHEQAFFQSSTLCLKIEMKMATISNPTLHSVYSRSSENVFSRFMTWCNNQQENRLLWLGITLTGHGCVITPLTIMAVLLAGTNMFLFITVLAAMGLSLVTNLAALPTRITIPVFILTILVDLVVIISCLVIGFDITSTYI